MKRKIYKQLLNWRSSKEKKPLIIGGARQVGKTYSVRELLCHRRGRAIVSFIPNEKAELLRLRFFYVFSLIF